MRTILVGLVCAAWLIFVLCPWDTVYFPRRRVIADWIFGDWEHLLVTFLAAWFGFWLMLVLLR